MTHDLREALTAAYQNTDDADPALVLAAVRHCALSWDGDARLLGNVRAKDIVRAIDALSNPPAAGNAGAEARLRVKTSDGFEVETLQSGRITKIISGPYTEALSAVGDEAKKSEGGKEPRGCPTPGACSCPTDPTADRREIVALDRQFIIDLIREKYDPVPSDWLAKDANCWDDGTGEIADAILAALDGGADA